MIQIIIVRCTKCDRQFRTVSTVVEGAAIHYCPKCGTRMNVSSPEPVSVLSTIDLNAA